MQLQPQQETVSTALYDRINSLYRTNIKINTIATHMEMVDPINQRIWLLLDMIIHMGQIQKLIPKMKSIKWREQRWKEHKVKGQLQSQILKNDAMKETRWYPGWGKIQITHAPSVILTNLIN